MPNELERAAGTNMDLLPFFYGGDGVAWQCGAEQMRIHKLAGDGDNWVRFLLSKNLNAEQFHISHGWIFRGMDTSPDLPSYYMTYTLHEGEYLPGHAWFPRYASVGSWFVTNGWTEFFWKGPFVSAEGTSTGDTHKAGTQKTHKYYDPWKVKFEAYYAIWSPTGRNPRHDVAHFRSYKAIYGEYVPQEDYAFAKGYGMIGWQKYEGGKPKGWAWIDNEKSEPRELYLPPNGWPILDGKSLIRSLPDVSTDIPKEETTEPDEVHEAVPLYGLKRDIMTFNIDIDDLDPAKGMSKDQVKQCVIDGEASAVMIIENVGDAIEMYERMSAYCDDPFVVLRLYNIFRDTEDGFDGLVWLNHSVAELEAWIVQNIQRPGGRFYNIRHKLSKIWLQLSLNEPHFAIGKTDKNHPKSLYKLIQWLLALAKVAVRLKQRISLGSLGAAAVIQNGVDEIALGWWRELLEYLVDETDGVPNSEYVVLDLHEYTDHNLLAAFVANQRKAILQAANGTGPLVDPDSWPMEAPPAKDCWHLLRVERLQVECERLTGKRFLFSCSEHGWDLMDDVMSSDFNKPEFAYLKAYAPDYDEIMAGAKEHTIREYLSRKTGDPLFGKEQRGPLTLRPYNAATLSKETITDDESAAFQFKQAVQVANIYPKECKMLAHYGPNNDWFNDANGEKCEGKGFDWARAMGRMFMILFATSKAHTYDEVQAIRAGQGEPMNPVIETPTELTRFMIRTTEAGRGLRVREQPATNRTVKGSIPAEAVEGWVHVPSPEVKANGYSWVYVKFINADGDEVAGWAAWKVLATDVIYLDMQPHPKETGELPAVDPDDTDPPTTPPQEPDTEPDEVPEIPTDSSPGEPGEAPEDNQGETPTDEPETPGNGEEPPKGMAEIRLDTIAPEHLPSVAEVGLGIALAALGIPAYIYTVEDAIKMLKAAAGYAMSEADAQREAAEAADAVFGNGAKSPVETE